LLLSEREVYYTARPEMLLERMLLERCPYYFEVRPEMLEATLRLGFRV
jgi:hypothetical protein